MGVMSANIKLFYQCRKFWFLYAVLSGVVVVPFIKTFVADSPEAGAGHFAFYLLPACLSGFLGAGLQQEILSKPFAFPLPGNDEIPRRLLFRIGWLVSLVYSVTFLVYPGGTTAERLLILGSGVAMGMTAYLLGVWSVLGSSLGYRVTGIVFIFVPVVILLRGHPLLESIIVDHPLMTILISGSIACLTWRDMDGRVLARRSLDKPFLRTVDSVNAGKAGRFRRTGGIQKLEEGGNRWIGTAGHFCLSRMDAHAPFTKGRYMWGAVHEAVGRSTATGWQLGLLVYVLFAGVLGYTAGTLGTRGDAFRTVVFFFPCMIGMDGLLPVHATMLLAGGRKERFWGGMATACGVGLFAVSAAVLIGVVTQGMAYLLPPIPLSGMVCVYAAPDFRDAFLPLLLVPVFFVSQLVLLRYGMLVQIIPAMVLMWTVSTWLPFLHRMGPLYIGLHIVTAWLVAALVLAYICARRDLVGR